MLKRKYHKYPFFILLFIHTCLLLITFYKRRDKSLLVLLLSNIGLAYLFEYIILNLFNAYKYKPKILNITSLDNILGAILSQAIYVPFTSIFQTAFNLKWKYKLMFTFYFVIIELLFLRLGVYATTWWRTSYTAMLIPVYFFISDWWFKKLTTENSVIRFISLFLSIAVSGINILYVLAVKRTFRFGRGNYHSWSEHFKIAPLYSLTLSFISACLVTRSGWLPKVLIVIFAMIFDVILYQLKIVKTNFKIIGQNVMIHILMVFVSIGFKKLIYSNDNKSPMYT